MPRNESEAAVPCFAICWRAICLISWRVCSCRCSRLVKAKAVLTLPLYKNANSVSIPCQECDFQNSELRRILREKRHDIIGSQWFGKLTTRRGWSSADECREEMAEAHQFQDALDRAGRLSFWRG